MDGDQLTSSESITAISTYSETGRPLMWYRKIMEGLHTEYARELPKEMSVGVRLYCINVLDIHIRLKLSSMH